MTTLEKEYEEFSEAVGLPPESQPSSTSSVTRKLECNVFALAEATTLARKPASARAIEEFSESKRQSTFMLGEICFLRICKQSSISTQELSALFVRSGFEFERMRENFHEVLVRCPNPTKNTIGDGYCLRHPLLEAYLAAVHLARSPVMAVVNFVTEILPVAEEGWSVLKILSGLCGGNMWSDHEKSMLPQIMNCVFTTQLPVNEPVVLLPQFLHILECLKESEDPKLYRMLLRDYLMAQTIILSPTDLEYWMSSIAAFVVHALPSNEHWTCFVSRGKSLALVNKFCQENQGFVVARDISALTIELDRDLLVLTTRKVDYLHYTLEPFIHRAISQRVQDVHRSKTLAAPPLLPEASSSANPQSPSQQSFGPYGYITKAQYESKRKMRNMSHFNLVKDLVVPHIPKHSTELVKAQYRKSDHLWMSVSSNVHNDWYEVVRTAPNVPIHWVRVRQPDGFEESEKKFKSKAELETLRPKKVELGATTTLANSFKEGESAAQGQPQVPLSGRSTRNESSLPAAAAISSLASFIPKLTKPYLEATADLEAIAVLEHQIKKEATNGFDQPGYCFYGDKSTFQGSYACAFPDTLSTCGMLREGGSGVVLEVKYSDEVYAAKRTALRSREGLIMSKLRHKNILKLVTMMTGQHVRLQLKREYEYNFYPKMSNDLGRSVGSFEKHCIRTLCECYLVEPLLLKKIRRNFRYVAHEILAALEYSHSQPHPIVHRDVKVSNILVRMACDCRNPLTCVCRKKLDIVPSDFDASLEFQKDGTLEADQPRSSAFGFQTTFGKVYHVSAVGTTGYKSPEGSMYCTGNSLDVTPPLSTKADIFSFGLLMSLLFLNSEGPKSQFQMAKMLLPINQMVEPRNSLNVAERDRDNVLPFLHILDCLKESEDPKLYQMLFQDFLMLRTIVLSPTDLEGWMSSIAAFKVHALPSNEHWTCVAHRGKSLALVNKVCDENQGFIVAISQRVQDVPRSRALASPPLLPEASSSANPQSPSQQSFGPYGYITEAQYESKRKVRNMSHFNLVKDLVVPHIQKHSTELVKAQYRKSDHLWMSVSSNIRNDWYEAVRTAPNVPIHWVRVKQPDEFEESEKKFKSRAELETLRHRSTELVILNSQCMNLVEIATPSSNDSVTIALQAQCEDQDQGMIGCDFLRKEREVENLCWFNSRPFDIKSDQRIGRLLPLPPKKVELGATTTLCNISKEGDSAAQGQPQIPLSGRSTRNMLSPPVAPSISSLASFIPKLTKPSLEATADLEAIAVSEHEIKKEAMNGFDRPGYCFYGDKSAFQVSYAGTFPDTLSTCRMLKEGGNGVVLEVKYSGEVFAVKKTAFRWREVLIMPKLRHKNVLKLVEMMISQPIGIQPKRDYEFHFYTKMSDDLGRSVKTFEKHCMGILCERYSGEPLLLKKIKSHLCYMAREILATLEYLHFQPRPIVHRDVKVSNILVRMACDCHNPPICVCRKKLDIVLSDFDASLELETDDTIETNPPQNSAFGFRTTFGKNITVAELETGLELFASSAKMVMASNSSLRLPNLVVSDSRPPQFDFDQHLDLDCSLSDSSDMDFGAHPRWK